MPFVKGKWSKKERLLSDLEFRLGPLFGGERGNYVENCLRSCLDVNFNRIGFLVKIYLNYYLKKLLLCLYFKY